MKLTDAQIRHMVDRFLSWKLPEQFSPDDGISFNPMRDIGHGRQLRRTPSGTNLLSAGQAEEMVRHMIEDMP